MALHAASTEAAALAGFGRAAIVQNGLNQHGIAHRLGRNDPSPKFETTMYDSPENRTSASQLARQLAKALQQCDALNFGLAACHIQMALDMLPVPEIEKASSPVGFCRFIGSPAPENCTSRRASR